MNMWMCVLTINNVTSTHHIEDMPNTMLMCQCSCLCWHFIVINCSIDNFVFRFWFLSVKLSCVGSCGWKCEIMCDSPFMWDLFQNCRSHINLLTFIVCYCFVKLLKQKLETLMLDVPNKIYGKIKYVFYFVLILLKNFFNF